MAKSAKSVDDLITTVEAAELLELSQRQVREYALAGKLPGRQLNPRMWVFRRGDVKAFVKPPRGWKPGRPRKPNQDSKTSS